MSPEIDSPTHLDPSHSDLLSGRLSGFDGNHHDPPDIDMNKILELVIFCTTEFTFYNKFMCDKLKQSKIETTFKNILVNSD